MKRKFGTRGTFEPRKFQVHQRSSIGAVVAAASMKKIVSKRVYAVTTRTPKTIRGTSGRVNKTDRPLKVPKNKRRVTKNIERGDCPYILPIEYALTYNKDGRIGIYNKTERARILKRFHDKRKSRSWTKTIRYTCRKNLAQNRHRVRGRFVKAVPSTKKSE